MADREGWVTVYHAADDVEAQIVLGLLDANDIEAGLLDQETGLPGLTVDSPQILVHPDDQERAEDVLDEYEEKLIERAERPDWKCPACGKTVSGAYTDCYHCSAAPDDEAEDGPLEGPEDEEENESPS
jgi:hypothetical protein